MPASSTDYDSPWKEALEYYFKDFLALLAPWLHDQIDWSHLPVFLDKELQAVAHQARAGRRYADKLVRLRLKDQRPVWLLVHVEVQGGAASVTQLALFGERMFQYYCRINDHQAKAWTSADGTRHTRQLLSLGVLTASAGADTHRVYTQQSLDACGVQFRFPVIHLASWLARWEELERHAAHNPFAVVVMAQLQAQQTPLGNGSQGRRRLASKTRIMRLMYQHGYSQAQFLRVYRLIDWMMALPAALEPAFEQALTTLDKEYNVAFVTSIERRSELKGRQEGKREGRLEGQAALLQRQLVRKFGPLPEALPQRIQGATLDQLETWSLNILDAATLEEVFAE